MRALESRKQLLIAESELNRAHLVHELQTMAGEGHALARQAKTITSMASAAALLVAGLTSFRHKKTAATAEKSSWGQTIGKVAGMVSTLWPVFRRRSRPEREFSGENHQATLGRE
jgi:hypothetical protein